MKKNIILLVSIIALSCKPSQSTQTSTTSGQNESQYLTELTTIMQGNYTSEAQSVKDTSYYNISLRMVPIWKNRGHYLYVEQALSSKLDKPYRVRIYKVSQRNENEIISEIYTLKNEKDWIGKWNTPDAFDAISEKDIDLKPGCEVVLKRAGLNKFIGQTGVKTCPSELRGASYATSKVNVYQDKIVSWDQGFDKDDKQVWGAEKGGYIFLKY